MKNNQEYLLSSVKNALRLLRTFTMDEPEKKVTELAVSLGLGKSTVSRLLATLASEGFVIKDPETQKYRLGLSILHLNTVLTSNLEINRESDPILQRLVQEIGETAHIAVLEGMDVVYLNQVECKHPVKILSHIGRRNPAHCTSSGKVLLANSEEKVIDQYIEKGLQKYTAHTITSSDDFRAALKSVKEQEYAISIEEILEGVASIAAPIRDYTGKVVYAITVIGPVHRMNPHNISIINKVKNAAKEISDRLGYWKNGSI
ncbi:IclR family transcriptional regulator [Paenactinomyces guangxiensis]|uniref:Glycerol operon regulatory protein n=1 Tax=Paenactinomyces guangxiensis TaxID=1490290 RepID=A0A7W1WPB6_9BACL|nr:IclR family transcriptional regulator [Paenactinomyces guangxiensis]MBA4493555.1 IclR family transcriptional regulator [Paenactinomyces guangxiensis]MBH8590646.1 IclR family transcriptional regulator [Paenactinomyces guangxiensis]